MFTNGLGCHSIKDTMHNDLPERYRVYLAYLISTYVRVSEKETFVMQEISRACGRCYKHTKAII